VSAPSRLTCEQIFARLDDFVDRELSPREMRLVQEHLDTCAQCAGEHRFEATVISDVRAKLGRIDVPVGLALRIAQRLSDLTGDAKAEGA
jgi:anti-sigma factor (TIGR02949 family)